MRIVIDMQGAQSSGSRNRGIGRYSMALAQAIIRNRGKHEVVLALNGLFADTIEPIRAAFDQLIPKKNIRIWYGVGPVAEAAAGNEARRRCAELIRESFLCNLEPDLVLVSSLVEGHIDDAVTSIGSMAHVPTAVIIYDLIPYIYREKYLGDPSQERWYLRKLDHMRRADLWLSISESSRQEGLKYLNLPAERVINISTAADPQFQSLTVPEKSAEKLRKTYGLRNSFVMYGGGIDYRKNIEGLLRAFAKLPSQLRKEHQLAIVCAVRDEDKYRLLKLANEQGLAAGNVVFTGFVPEEDLIALYNLCRLFVFPSWHEGFGLPVLEAMACGAPVIGANRSSIPEVIGLEEALFDPYSDDAIATAMERVLTSDSLRNELIRHGEAQALKFSWDTSAQRAISAFEQRHRENTKKESAPAQAPRRPLLAYVSPLPPAQSGIADYSAELLPELARHYEIELIVAENNVSDAQIKSCWPIRPPEWFIDHASNYDRVLYHFGNSDFHQHMFSLLDSIPGVVVLHDFFLSGILAHMEVNQIEPKAWFKALYHSHGYSALNERLLAPRDANVIWKYPCNLHVLQRALGVIVHSNHSRQLAREWYGPSAPMSMKVVPLARQSQLFVARSRARATLGFREADFVVCSFGVLGPTKLNHRLIDAWLDSELSDNPNCHLVFVGKNDTGDYGKKLVAKIKKHKPRSQIHITGWVDSATYREYLSTADAGVQLRTFSRGETSAAVFDCMNYGMATIVNACGSMAEVPDHAVWKLPECFSDEQLAGALETLLKDKDKRIFLGSKAREIIHNEHNPRKCADQYASKIETFYAKAQLGERALVSRIASLCKNAEETELAEMAIAISRSTPQQPRMRQLLVDISDAVLYEVKTGIQSAARSLLLELLNNPPEGFRVEPVYVTADQGYRYARSLITTLFEYPTDFFEDEPLEVYPEDIFLGLDPQPKVVSAHSEYYQWLRQQGAEVWFVVYDVPREQMPICFKSVGKALYESYLSVIAETDGAVCISRSVAEELKDWVKENCSLRKRSFQIAWFHPGADIEKWLATFHADSHPTPENIPWVTWKESADKLKEIIVGC